MGINNSLKIWVFSLVSLIIMSSGVFANSMQDLANTGEVTIYISDHNSSINITNFDLSGTSFDSYTVNVTDLGIPNINFNFTGLNVTKLLDGVNFTFTFNKNNNYPDFINSNFHADGKFYDLLSAFLAYYQIPLDPSKSSCAYPTSCVSPTDLNTGGSWDDAWIQVINYYNANVTYDRNAVAIKNGNDYYFWQDQGYADLNATTQQNIRDAITDRVKSFSLTELLQEAIKVGNLTKYIDVGIINTTVNITSTYFNHSYNFDSYNFTYLNSSIELKSGDYVFVITVADKNGNTASKAIRVILDLTSSETATADGNGDVAFTLLEVNTVLEKISNVATGTQVTATVYGNTLPSGFTAVPSSTAQKVTDYFKTTTDDSPAPVFGEYNITFAVTNSSLGSYNHYDVRLVYFNTSSEWAPMQTYYMKNSDGVNTYVATVTYLGYTSADSQFAIVADNKFAIDNALNDLDFSDIKGSNSVQTSISNDLNLIRIGSESTKIDWSSNNTAVISANGKVTQPQSSQPNADVTLTASTSKPGLASKTKTFDVTVVASSKTDAQAVSDANASLAFSTIQGSNSASSSVTSNLNLITSHTDKTSISWSSNSTNVVSNSGNIYQQSTDKDIKLTATITRGSASATKIIVVTVTGTPDLDLQDVQSAKLALTDTVVLAGNMDKGNVIANLYLPTSLSAYPGVSIAWDSSDSSVIATTGIVTRSQTSDTTVNLNATFSKNLISSMKSFSLVVKIQQAPAVPQNNTVTVPGDDTEVIIDFTNAFNITSIIIPSTVSNSSIISLNMGQFVNSTGNLTLSTGNSLTMTRSTATVSYTAEIQNGTVVSGGANWNGVIGMPSVKLASNYSLTSGETINSVVEVGLPSVQLNFSNPVKITLGGQAGKLAAFSRGDNTTLTKITTQCNSITNPTNVPTGGECYVDSGSDLVIWTYHFTAYSSYTKTPDTTTTTTTASNSGGGGGFACTSDWQCSDWTACASGTQTRTCQLQYDYCVAATAKPAEIQSCTVPVKTEPIVATTPAEATPTEQQNQVPEFTTQSETTQAGNAITGQATASATGNFLTGAATAVGGVISKPQVWISALVIALIAAGIYGSMFYFKTSNLTPEKRVSLAIEYHRKAQEYHMMGKIKKADKYYKKAEKLRRI